MGETDPVVSMAGFDAVVFDTDGVITDTAVLHAAAWKQVFDEFLGRRAERDGVAYAPFDEVHEYLALVDGKARYDGVRSVLTARGIVLDDGSPGDAPADDTVCALGNTKDRYFHDHLVTDGVRVFPDAVRFLDRLAGEGRHVAVVSASRNAREVLRNAGVLHRFEVAVDGVDSERLGLAGKPDPALFLAAADRLGLEPARTVVVEDAVAGVAAGRRGGFGLVVGVDRVGQATALSDAGAHAVVHDLDEVVV